MTWKRNGYEEIAKRSEQKSDQLYNTAGCSERKATKASSELHRIMGSNDVPIEASINWRRLF